MDEARKSLPCFAEALSAVEGEVEGMRHPQFGLCRLTPPDDCPVNVAISFAPA